MPRRRLAVTAALALAVLSAPPAGARKPVVAWVDDGQRMHLYDSQLGRELTAPALTIPDRTRGFAVSPSGRYVVYRDAAKRAHLFDRATRSDAVLAGFEGTPRSVSDGALIAADQADNGPARVYDGRARRLVPTGLDDANGTNGHRQSHISGDGRLLATTCLSGCIKSTVDNDADAFVQDLRTKLDTAFPDNVSGQPKRDEEHPCIDGDGSRVGIDTSPAPNDRDVFVYDRAAQQTLVLPGLNLAGESIVYCALDAAGAYVGFMDQGTGVAGLYDVAAKARVALPATIMGPVWLVAPYAPRVPRLLTAAAAAPRAFRPAGRGGRGTTLRIVLNRRAVVTVSLRRGNRVLRTYALGARRGIVRLAVDGRRRVGSRRVPLAAAVYALRVEARVGRARDRRTVSVRVLP